MILLAITHSDYFPILESFIIYSICNIDLWRHKRTKINFIINYMPGISLTFVFNIFVKS